MKLKLMAAVLAVSAQPSFACNYDIITLTGWTITPQTKEQNTLDTEFLYNGGKAIRLIDASVGFSDVLGARIGSFGMDRDLPLEPNQTFTQTGLWGMYTFERLLDLEKSDVETIVCVNGVAYVDGTKEIFE